MRQTFYAPGDITLDLCINGKFNGIIGDSGTGMSLLCSLAGTIRRARGFPEKQPRAIGGDDSPIESWSLTESEALIIVDGDIMESNWRRLLWRMKHSSNCYIICTRERNLVKLCGVENIFVLERSSKCLRMVPAPASLLGYESDI